MGAPGPGLLHVCATSKFHHLRMADKEELRPAARCRLACHIINQPPCPLGAEPGLACLLLALLHEKRVVQHGAGGAPYRYLALLTQLGDQLRQLLAAILNTRCGTKFQACSTKHQAAWARCM